MTPKGRHAQYSYRFGNLIRYLKETYNVVHLMQFTFTTVLQRKTIFTVSVEMCFETSLGIENKKWRVRNRKKWTFSELYRGIKFTGQKGKYYKERHSGCINCCYGK
jgi:hypothetical protein